MGLDGNDPSINRFAHNMVTLVMEAVPVGKEPTTGNASGFVIDFRGKRWLVTAGHVALLLAALHNARRLIKVFCCDAWAGSDGIGRPVVLPTDYADRWIVFGDEHSYDVALLDLGLNLASQIEAGGRRRRARRRMAKRPGELRLLCGARDARGVARHERVGRGWRQGRAGQIVADKLQPQAGCC